MRRIVSIAILCLCLSSCASAPTRCKDTVADENVVLPPAWAFGILYGGYTNQQQTIARIDEILQHDYPIDAYWIDSWFWSHADKGVGPKKYMDFVADTVGYPARADMWNYMSSHQIRGGFWAWDCIMKTGNENAYADFQQQGFFRDTYFEKNTWHNGDVSTAMFQAGKDNEGTECGNIDFDNPDAVAYFKKRMKPFFDEGADFIKLDRTSSINVCKAMFELSQEYGKETRGRGFIFSHTGGMESDAYKRYPCKWTDDTRSDWNVKSPNVKFNDWVPNVALEENIALFIDTTKLCSRIPFLANDMGGFDMGFTTRPDENLYIRWMQFSIFTPIVEVFAQPENATANLAYNYSELSDSLFREYAHLRMQLFPYIYSYAHAVRMKGQQMMNRVPGDGYTYLFGNELLVSPVYTPSKESVSIDFPEGEWIHYWTGTRVKGGNKQNVDAPLSQIPLYVKAGSFLPMREYAPNISTGTNDLLILHIYSGSNSEFTMVEDDGESCGYEQGEYLKTNMIQRDYGDHSVIEIEAAQGMYEGMSDERKIRVIFHTDKAVSQILVNKNAVSFDVQDGNYYLPLVVQNKYKKLTIKISY